MEHNDSNLGAQLSTFETKKSSLTSLKVWAVISFAVLVGLGIILLFVEDDPDIRILSFLLFGLGIILPVMLLFLSKMLYQQVIIFEEGVVVKERKKVHSFHFNEIAGLRENTYDNMNTAAGIGSAGGAVGGLIIGTVFSIMNSASDKSKKKHKLRSLFIVPSGYKAKPVGVVNTGGNELSRVYTGWLIRKNGVNKENLNSLSLSFGQKLELSGGAFIHKKRNKEVKIPFSKNVNIDTKSSANYGVFTLVETDEKGKARSSVALDAAKVFNIDLLNYIFYLIHS
ncbi:MAG: hypothetical protein FWD48_05650 [Oscillospiraceae bacterium]|nr:hypothetical protein [Oscillospiraceae bacterium]